MKHFIQRIIPIDQTLKDQFEQESKKHLEKWFNKWFGKNTLIYKGLVEDIQKSSEDEIYILVNHKPIMRFCCSMSMLIKLLTGRSISDNNHDQALKFILRLVEDLINRFGTFKDEKITIGNNDNKENPLSLSVYSVDTHSGFIEIDFLLRVMRVS